MIQTRNRRLFSVLAILLVFSAVFIGIWYGRKKQAVVVNPEEIRDDKLSELELRAGEYDEYSIVLSDTSLSEATALAKMLDAKLRITSDGSFATLTLTDGRTIKDIYDDDAYLQYIDSLSTDWQATVSGKHDGGGNDRVPSAPTDWKSHEAELQEYLDYLNLSTVWNNTTGSGITVAVIDTGIDTDHSEFSGRISEYSYNATEDKIVKDYTLADGSYDWSLIEDEVGHGTAVAGAFAASMDGSGMVGVAPQVTVIVIKAECDANGSFARTSDLVFGLYYAIERDVSVVNMSFGTYGFNPFSEATQLAYDSDVLCVAAAGNDGTAALCYPAADEHVIGVGALSDGSWELAAYSNYGENVDVVAPGTVYTAAMGGGYSIETGTSLASPLVAGVISLLSQTEPYITFDEVYELLVASSYDLGDLGHDYYYGYGAIDASALLLEKRGTITYDMMTNELDDTEGLFIVGHTLQEVLEPERLYAVFDGWYYDPYYTEEYVWYEDAIDTDITVYAKWENEEDGIPYTYVELDDGTIEIRSYTGHRRYITVPEYIDGKPVTSIGDFAFDGQSKLREIGLPSGLRHIGLYAFRNCSNLLNISIPSGVTKIEEGAFYGSVRLSAVAFAGTPQLKTIGSFAFASCSGISRIEIPASVTAIGTGAFRGDISLTEIAVQRGNMHFVGVNGVLFNATKSTLLAYPAARTVDYTVPNGTTAIADYSFAYAHLGKVDFNQTTVIGDYAFECSYLASVFITDFVTSMGEGTFSGCARLSDVTFGENSRLTRIGGSAFFGCSSLRTMAIPNSVTQIDGAAFQYSALCDVTFGESSTLTSIGASAFACTPLRSIALPKSLNTVGSSAFYYCLSLSDVTFGEDSNLNIIGSYAFAITASLTDITFPSRLTQLGDFAFLSSALDGDVTIPASLTYFGAGAFASCRSLENIFVCAENTGYCDRDGVVYTKDGKKAVAYPAGNSRTSYQITQGVETVGAAAFYGAAHLESVALPESLVYIEEYAFAYVTALNFMALPSGVMQIGRYAFLCDMSMSTVTFGENCVLPRIGYGAFAYCGITSITVPKSVSTIAQGAFEGCTKLTSVIFAANSKLESVSAYMFDGATNLQTVKFENGSALTAIQAHGFEGMTKLTSVDFGDAKLTEIDNFACRFCESLTSFTVPNGVKNIGRYAFYGCYGLTSVTVPESTEHIGSYAFLQTSGRLEVYFAAETLPLYLDEDWDRGIKGYYLGVTSVATSGDYRYAKLTSGDIAILEYLGTATELDLSAVELGGNITTIGGSAFAYATVERITLPETLVTIQRSGFYHSALTSIAIPASVEFIGTEAFADTPITSVTFAGGSHLTVVEQSAFEGTKHLTAAVTVPASVTTLGRAIFRNSAVTTVAFESGTTVTEIPIEMFHGAALTSFAVPNSVTKICDGAFEGTADLTSVTYGENLTWLGARAFYQSGLESFHIRKTLTVLEEFSLVSLESLTAFTVDADHPYYLVENGLLLSKDGSKLVVVPAGKTGVLTVPVSVEKIGYGAFEATALSAVLFDERCNLLSIGYRAFFGAEEITEITVPSSVVAIDYYAFAYAKNLRKVTFADGSQLKGIYEGAFYGCINLSDITVPDSIVEISDYAFYGCTNLKKLPVSETSEIKGFYTYAFAYTGMTELTVPESVIDIDDYAFLGSALVKVTIPDTNAKELIIGLGAFEDCASLEEITLPFIGASYEDDEITWFGYIFGAGGWQANSTYVPESLKKVTVNSNITVVYSYAFYQLADIEEIVVPDSVTDIYYGAFYETTAVYDLTNEIRLFDWEGERVTQIGKIYFFLGIGFKTLNIAEGVTRIGEEAFSLATEADISISRISITSITIPKSVTSIDQGAFFGCYQLRTIYNNSDIELTIGSSDNGEIAYYAKVIVDKNGNVMYAEDGMTYIKTEDDFLFVCESGTYKLIEYFGTQGVVTLPTDINGNSYEIYEMTGVRHVIVPDTVTEIGNHAFRGCSRLRSVMLQNSVTSIGRGAFSSCVDLKSITIPDSVTSIGNYAFSGCSSLTSIIIPEGVTTIGDSAFSGCESLKSITIPNGVTSIGESAFRNCNSLTSITIPDNVTFIGSYAFSGCESFKSITIPDGVTSIGCAVFSSCSSLESLVVAEENIVYHGKDNCIIQTATNTLIAGCKNSVIPAYVTTVGRGAFSGCSSLTSITLPSSVTTIGWESFRGCGSLASITLPDSVTSIGWAAFSECSSLTSITIPASVTSIDDFAFGSCRSLYAIYNKSAFQLTVGSGNNGEIAYYAKLIVDKDGNVTYAEDGTTYIKTEDDFLFSYQNGTYTLMAYIGVQNTVTLPKYINGNTYKISYMRGVQNVIIPDCVTSIDYCAFYDCSSLTSITIPDSVTMIDYFAFSFCTNLTSITIPDSVTSIGSYAFQGTAYYNDSSNWTDGSLYAGNCLIGVDTSAKIFAVREGTTAIAGDAFSGCYKLKHLTIGGNAYGFLSKDDLTNLVTLVLTEMPTSHTALGYFGWSADSIPSTLTNIVLAEGVRMCDDAFQGIEGVTIYVSESEKDVRWDANYPGWANGNKVVYGDDWITANFYNADGSLYSSELFYTSQVIRVPTIVLEEGEHDYYVLKGWDLDGDGMPDPFPATSSVDISAQLLVEKVTKQYTVSFVERDGTVISSQTQDYGTTIVAPAAPEKLGYTFGGWQGFTEGMTVTGDRRFVAKWTHDGDGHAYGAPVWVDATCTEGGYYKHTCTVCGEWYGTDYTDALGHSYSTVTVAPTCEKDGYDLHTCACGHSYQDNIVKAKGHTCGEWVEDVDATCTTNGSRHRDCACGHTEYEVLEATGHEYTSAVTKAATCTSAGEVTYICACGHAVIEEIPATEHNYVKVYADEDFVQWLIRLILNIFFGYDNGQPYYIKCADCGHIATSGEVSVVYSATASTMSTCEHTLGDWTVVSAATCTTSEMEGRICSKCNKTVEYRESAPATGIHIYTAVVTAPTCTECGYTTHTCDCGHSYVGDYVSATGHSYTSVVTEPTCTVSGFTTHTCDCGDSYIDTYVSATGHAYGEWLTVTKATCTKDGEKRRDCKNCEHYETEAIKATGHNYTSVVTAPTCTAQGYTTYTCTCGHSYVGDYVSATGHEYDEWSTVTKATCAKDGVKRRDCKNCNHYETEAIKATGHNYTSVVTEPTCTAQGYTTYTCACGHSYVGGYVSATGHSYTSVVTEPTCTVRGYTTHTCDCGDSYIDTYVSATGHEYGEWSTVTKATCTKDGVKRRDCKNCEHYETEAIKATGHHYTAVVTEPTCTVSGYTTYTCTCGHSYVGDYVSPKGHDYKSVVTAPTCTEKGSTTHTCSCGDSYKDNFVKAKGHTYGEWVVDVAATCTEDGSKLRACACGHTEHKVVEATGHSYKRVVTKEATASEFGIVSYTCQCGHSYTERVEKLAPKIIGGSEVTWNQKSKASLTFRSDAAIEDFIEVRINGIVLEPDCYSVREGSTIVEITAEYLDTLAVGEYFVSIVSTTGVAQERFHVAGAHRNTVVYVVIGAVAAAAAIGGCAVVLMRRKHKKTDCTVD